MSYDSKESFNFLKPYHIPTVEHKPAKAHMTMQTSPVPPSPMSTCRGQGSGRSPNGSQVDYIETPMGKNQLTDINA